MIQCFPNAPSLAWRPDRGKTRPTSPSSCRSPNAVRLAWAAGTTTLTPTATCRIERNIATQRYADDTAGGEPMTRKVTTTSLTRRAALTAGAAAGVMAALGPAARTAGAAAQAASARQLEPEAGSWNTWVLDSGDQLRPAAPPDRAE